MIRIVVCNHCSGVSKTTTTVTIARELTDRDKKVLVIDTDPQGSVATILNLKPTSVLSDLLVQGLNPAECIVSVKGNLDVICSDRATRLAEAKMMGNIGREMTFRHVFSLFERRYDVVMIDVSPSINLMQTCAMIYAEQVLIPVDMDSLSFQGAAATIHVGKSLNPFLNVNVRAIALLPVKVDRRLAITVNILEGCEVLSKENNVPLLPAIRTDEAVRKAGRKGQFLADYDPSSKALQDYKSAVDALLGLPIEEKAEAHR